MNKFEHYEIIAELYMRTHDFSDLSPAEFADKYFEVLDEIKTHYKSDSKQKVNY